MAKRAAAVFDVLTEAIPARATGLAHIADDPVPTGKEGVNLGHRAGFPWVPSAPTFWQKRDAASTRRQSPPPAEESAMPQVAPPIAALPCDINTSIWRKSTTICSALKLFFGSPRAAFPFSRRP